MKSSRSSDVFLMSANAITRSNLFYDPLQDVLHDLLHDLLQKSILGRHSLNAHPLIGRIQIQYDFASTNHHRYQLPSKNVFRENARSGLPIVSRAESDEIRIRSRNAQDKETEKRQLCFPRAPACCNLRKSYKSASARLIASR